MDVENLDAMSADELLAFQKKCQALARYAAIKRLAVKARLSGRIRRAVDLESNCETIYNDLPDDVRWLAVRLTPYRSVAPGKPGGRG